MNEFDDSFMSVTQFRFAGFGSAAFQAQLAEFVKNFNAIAVSKL